MLLNLRAFHWLIAIATVAASSRATDPSTDSSAIADYRRNFNKDSYEATSGSNVNTGTGTGNDDFDNKYFKKAIESVNRHFEGDSPKQNLRPTNKYGEVNSNPPSLKSYQSNSKEMDLSLNPFIIQRAALRTPKVMDLKNEVNTNLKFDDAFRSLVGTSVNNPIPKGDNSDIELASAEDLSPNPLSPQAARRIPKVLDLKNEVNNNLKFDEAYRSIVDADLNRPYSYGANSDFSVTLATNQPKSGSVQRQRPVSYPSVPADVTPPRDKDADTDNSKSISPNLNNNTNNRGFNDGFNAVTGQPDFKDFPNIELYGANQLVNSYAQNRNRNPYTIKLTGDSSRSSNRNTQAFVDRLGRGNNIARNVNNLRMDQNRLGTRSHLDLASANIGGPEREDGRDLIQAYFKMMEDRFPLNNNNNNKLNSYNNNSGRGIRKSIDFDDRDINNNLNHLQNGDGDNNNSSKRVERSIVPAERSSTSADVFHGFGGFQTSVFSNQIFHAVCNMMPSTDAPYNVTGTVDFDQSVTSMNYLLGQLTVRVQLQGFSTNDSVQEHGLHVDAYGADLRRDCTTAGGHYNPFNAVHGARDSPVRHLGDFGNVREDQQGRIVTEFKDKVASLVGDHSIVGRALVIHESADDSGLDGTVTSLNNGNSGKPIACCIIAYSQANNLSGIRTGAFL